MKRLIVWLAVILTLAGCIVGGVRNPSLNGKEPVHHIEDATVALVMKDSDGDWRPYCAGVWLDSSTILTAAHCVNDTGVPEDPLGLYSEQWNPLGYYVTYMVKSDLSDEGPLPLAVGRTATIASIDETVDLALLRVTDAPAHDSVTISNAELTSGVNVICTGHTVGLWWTYSYGRIAATRLISSPDEHVFKTLQISIPIWRGNSGGGAFDEEGRLVGIASFIKTDAPNLSFFIHRDQVVKFIDQSRERPLLRH